MFLASRGYYKDVDEREEKLFNHESGEKREKFRRCSLWRFAL